MIHSESKSHLTQGKEKPCIVLVDGTYHLFRAYHALPPLHNQAGEPTGVLHGAIKIISKLRHIHRPEKLVTVFDAGGKNFRHEILTEYKQNRPPPPEDLLVQIEPLKQILCAMGIPVLSLSNVEADDVIATLARQAQRLGWYVIIATGDKDLAQLVNDDIVLENRHGAILDSAAVEKKYGVPPDKIIDWISLTGDNVDNIPGIEKVGPVTAAKWIHRFGGMDNILDQADSIRGKLGENLRSSMDRIKQNRDLVTLRDDLETIPDWSALTMRAVDMPALSKLCEKWQLRQVLEAEHIRVSDPVEEDAPEREKPSQLLLTKADFEKWSDHLKDKKCFAVAMTTDQTDTLRPTLTGLYFSTGPDETAYVSLVSDDKRTLSKQQLGVISDHLRSIFTHPGEILFHDLKRHLSILEDYGLSVSGGNMTDTMLEAYVLDSSSPQEDLMAVARRLLPAADIKEFTLFNDGIRAEVCLRLHQVLQKQLADQPPLEKILRSIEMPVAPILARMERYGVRIDKQSLSEQAQDLEREIKDVEKQADVYIGDTPINLNSSKQVRELLFDRLKLPVMQKTPLGVPSSSERVLQELAALHPLPDLILRHRLLSKLKSTYVDTLPEQADENDRIHTTYHQAKVVTGRLSSSGPNLQNIPIRTPEGRRIRSAFIATPGYVLLTADYSQIELRIIAHIANDSALLDVFAENGDVHRQTAAEIFGLASDEVQDEHRRIAKSINFGLIYGMSSFGLSRQLRIPLDEAQRYVDRFFQKYPHVCTYMEECRQRAKKDGYVETLFGRRIPTPESKRHTDRQHAQRMAINAPMQGTAADIIKKAMIHIDEWTTKRQYSIHMIMQVHDELVFEVPEGEEKEAMENVQQLMEKADDGLLQSSLRVNIAIGSNWEEAH